MKRLFSAIMILGTGVLLFVGFEQAASRANEQARSARTEWMAQTQSLGQAGIQLTNLEVRVRELEHVVRAVSGGASAADNEALAAIMGGNALSPEQSERLLADLGFNWETTGPYLIISKSNLGMMSLDGVEHYKLNQTAGQVLAITPEERVVVEDALDAVRTGYQTWAADHVQRTEPKGQTVAEYSLVADAQLMQSLSNRFAGSVLTALGGERGKQLLDYSRDWMLELGLCGGETNTMRLAYEGSGQNRYLMLHKHGYLWNQMSCGVTPWQPFPESFLPLFPGGWEELARREGFELPKEFRKGG
jgi:hypothetical protein